MLYVSMPHSRHRLSSSLAHQPVSGVQFGMSFVRVVLPGSPYPPAMSLCVSWLCSVAGHSPSPSASVAAAAGCVVVLFFACRRRRKKRRRQNQKAVAKTANASLILNFHLRLFVSTTTTTTTPPPTTPHAAATAATAAARSFPFAPPAR